MSSITNYALIKDSVRNVLLITHGLDGAWRWGYFVAAGCKNKNDSKDSDEIKTLKIRNNIFFRFQHVTFWPLKHFKAIKSYLSLLII